MEHPRRRWLRFSLRGLLILTAVVAVWIGWNANIVRQRKVASAELRSSQQFIQGFHTSAEVEAGNQQFGRQVRPPRVSPLRQLLGDEGVYLILFNADYPQSKLEKMKAIFPEATVTKLQPDWRSLAGPKAEDAPPAPSAK